MVKNNKIIKDLKERNKKLVNAIINNFGIFSGPTLCYFTHSENPWKTAYNNGGKINDEAFKKFAKKIKEKYQINSEENIEKYANSLLENFRKNKDIN